MTVVALLVACGLPPSDSDSDMAAPWVDVDGHPLVWHAARRLREAGIGRVLLVSDVARASSAAVVAADRVFAGAVESFVLVAGSGLRDAVEAALAVDPSVVLVHDPTRAFAPTAMIRRIVDAVRDGAPVVIPVLPVVDTIRAAGTNGQASALVDRDGLRIVQTPHGFAPETLRRRHGLAPGGAASSRDRPSSGRTPQDAVTLLDEAAAAALAGVPLLSVPGHADAARVLTPGDIDQARRALGTAVAPPAGGRRVDVRG